MDAKRVESVIETNIAGAYAEASTEGSYLHLTVAFEARNSRDAHTQVMKVLSDAGALEIFHGIQVGWHSSEQHFKGKKLKAAIEEALKPLLGHPDWNPYSLDVNIAGSTLAISVSSRHLAYSKKTSEAYERILAMSQGLLDIAGAHRISIHFDDGRLPPYPQHGPCEDDDDDEGNPNWPSKTGNPSGGGRGNNPPR